MKRASTTEAKTNLSALIDSLKRGSAVLIVDRGRPAARLEPVTADLDAEPDGRLLRLVRDGVVRLRRAAPPPRLFSQLPPRAKAGASAIKALLEEHREGR
jgi:antitoxin (DNA-binding transcriptional repressor) of toxin-antitoxin stability system